MNPFVSTAAAVTNGRELLYLVAAVVCLLLALHYLRRVFTPLGELIRVVAAATMIALSIGAALILLVVISIGGR